MNEFPRRNQVLQWLPAEHAIQHAVDLVETMGADVRLTDAVILLGRARGRVADFIDRVPDGEQYPRFVEKPIGWISEDHRRLHERHQELQRTLRRIEHRLDLIYHTEKRIMGAVEDAVAKLNGISDEADAIKAGVTAIEEAQATGDQATIDAAVAQATATISAAADNTKAHVDAALAVVQQGLPPAPPAPDQPAQ